MSSNAQFSKYYSMKDLRIVPFKPVLESQLKSDLNLSEDAREKIEEAKSKLKSRVIQKGEVKGYFVYILLDERISDVEELNFNRFIDHVMYVGRGEGDRTLQHWNTLFKDRNKFRCPKKYDYLLMLNNLEKGYIPLALDKLLAYEESEILECSIIDLLDVDNLLNTVVGVMYAWCEDYESMNNYLALGTLLDLYNQFVLEKPKAKRFEDLAELRGTQANNLLKNLEDCVSDDDKEEYYNLLNMAEDESNSESDWESDCEETLDEEAFERELDEVDGDDED